jgi:hypothetical protein
MTQSSFTGRAWSLSGWSFQCGHEKWLTFGMLKQLSGERKGVAQGTPDNSGQTFGGFDLFLVRFEPAPGLPSGEESLSRFPEARICD